MGQSVVAWDGDVDELQWGVGITQGNAGDVGVGGFNNGLSVDSWIGNDDQLWFDELLGDIIGDGTWDPSGRSGSGGTDFLGELEDGSLTGISSRNDHDVLWVGDGNDSSGGELDLLPSFFEVNDVSLSGILFGGLGGSLM